MAKNTWIWIFAGVLALALIALIIYLTMRGEQLSGSGIYFVQEDVFFAR